MVVFRLAGHSCAVRLDRVREIVPMPELSCPPGMPSLLEGFLNLAGTAIPVLRLDRLFGFEEQPIELFTPLLIVDSGAGLLALLVERVTDVLRNQESEPGAAANSTLPVKTKDTFNGCVESVVQAAGRTIHVLAIDRILLEKERRCLADFQSREQHRIEALAEART